MKQPKEIMRFRYRALFQSVDILFFEEPSETNKKITCEADLKLPLIKKSYSVSTLFDGDYKNWTQHYPVREKKESIHVVEKNEFNMKAMDPIGFFMLLENEDWPHEEVDLLVGAKILRFRLNSQNDKIEIQRQDKDQKLVIQKANGRIDKIEIPVPMIGNLCIERV